MWRSLLYREPSVERVATLDRWLRANPGAWVRLYHGTDAALPVARKGLKPTGEGGAIRCNRGRATCRSRFTPDMQRCSREWRFRGVR